MSSISSESGAATSCVGAVVIGRNEGERLRMCLESVLPQVRETVYVDSGSTDGSVALAARMGAEVVDLTADFGFTAARARNAGWMKLLERYPDIRYVQFVDGDCVVDRSWIGTAQSEFANRPEVAIIFGHVREAQPTRNIYHRLAAMEWDTPVGLTRYCGGIAMVRTSALLQVNGYRDGLIAGEEPELCVRLRQTGWSIVKLNQEMASHDCGLDSFSKWWRRSVRNGRAYAEGASLHGNPPERHWVKETRSIWFWGIAVPIIGLAMIWPTRGVSVAIVAALYIALVARIALRRISTTQSSIGDAVLYAAFCVIGKWPQAVGLGRYYLGAAK